MWTSDELGWKCQGVKCGLNLNGIRPSLVVSSIFETSTFRIFHHFSGFIYFVKHLNLFHEHFWLLRIFYLAWILSKISIKSMASSGFFIIFSWMEVKHPDFFKYLRFSGCWTLPGVFWRFWDKIAISQNRQKLSWSTKCKYV